MKIGCGIRNITDRLCGLRSQGCVGKMLMHWMCAIVVFLLALPPISRAQAVEGWDLITLEEETRDNAAPHVSQPAPQAVPHSPVIDVRQPNLARPIFNPTTINVQFRAAHGAIIVMSTFRATYGWLGIDITARLLEHATKTANSLSAQNVDLPVGDHKITVTIADNHGRTGSRVLRMSVAQ
jgi:hypothetical protein